jgi:P27 family predicted phage terminase small subunit
MTPKKLSPDARRLYRKLRREWAIDDQAGQFLLCRAMECWDRLRQAQMLIEREGILKADRFGQDKPHPATQVEKEARAHLLQCFKALNLDLDSLKGK